MRKLKLDIADLEVTSFDIDRVGGLRGTIAGHVTLPATYGTKCDQTFDGCGTGDPFECPATQDCNTANGNVSCDQYSCVDDSGCGLCYTHSCAVTYCTCPGNC